MRRRCMPNECPRQSVGAVVARNKRNASQVKQSGPPIRAAAVMPEIQSDFTGCQRTSPSTAPVSLASNIRGERNVLADRASASSTGSPCRAGGGARAELTTMAWPFLSFIRDWPALLGAQRAKDGFRIERHFHQSHADCVVDCVRDGRRHAKGRHFAHALGAEGPVRLLGVEIDVLKISRNVMQARDLVICQ